MTPDQIAALVAQTVQAVMANQAKPSGKAGQLASKDQSILRTFTKRGYKDVVLMDRTDPKKPFNVRPFKGWLDQGRVVRKGEKSVRGLFHVSQTDPVTTAPKAPKEGPKPAASPVKPTAEVVAAAVSKIMAEAAKKAEQPAA